MAFKATMAAIGQSNLRTCHWQMQSTTEIQPSSNIAFEQTRWPHGSGDLAHNAPLQFSGRGGVLRAACMWQPIVFEHKRTVTLHGATRASHLQLEL